MRIYTGTRLMGCRNSYTRKYPRNLCKESLQGLSRTITFNVNGETLMKHIVDNVNKMPLRIKTLDLAGRVPGPDSIELLRRVDASLGYHHLPIKGN